MVMGLIMLGVATPSESAATGVLGAILTAAYYKRLSFKMMFEAVGEAALLSSVILLILCSAVMFTQLLAFTGATSALTEVVTTLEVNRWVMFFIMMALPFFLCMFIDQLGLMLIVVPIYLPIIKVLEFDPVWFWLLFLLNITLGAITPPFGYVMFAVKAAAKDVSMGEIFSASWLFVGLTLIGMVVMTVFPEIVTFLPNLANSLAQLGSASANKKPPANMPGFFYGVLTDLFQLDALVFAVEEDVRFQKHRQDQRAVRGPGIVLASRRAPDIVAGGNCAFIINQRAFEHEGLFQFHMLVKRQLGARRPFEQRRHHAGLLVLHQHLHFDAFAGRGFPRNLVDLHKT